MFKTYGSLRRSTHVLGVPEGMEAEKGLEGLFREILKNFPNVEINRYANTEGTKGF